MKAESSNVIRLQRLDRLAVEQDHWLERYLTDRLTDSERADFEAYCVEHPEVFDDAEAITRLQDGLARLKASGELATLVAPRPRWYRSAIAAAAALLFVVGALWLIGSQKPPVLTAVAQNVARSYQLMPTRTSSFDATIRLASQPRVVELRLRPEIASTGEYQVRLTAVRADLHAQITALRADAGGFVSVYLRTDRVTPGVYELQLAAVSGGSPATYLLELRSD